MPLKTGETEELTLNLTPMIDIVMLLIFFFMVGTEFSSGERQLEINLPTVAEALPLSGLPDELVINISQEGDLSLGQQPVTLAELENRLQEALARYSDQMVVIRGDARGVHQNLMNVLATCHRVGVANLSLGYRLEEE